jgi:heme/copper-type cytochrome/quinol oxidase subunit 3
MRRFRIWVLATVFFGVTFIGGQIFEFTHFTREGLNIDTSVFGSTFYVLTGLHGAHVVIGIIWLLSLWGLSMQEHMGQGDAERVEVAGLYWHFVDVVWIVIFTVVYLVPKS